MIKILIADDHPVVRAGIRQILAEDDDMVVCGEAKNGLEVVEMVKLLDPDVVLLDISMPGRNCVDTLKRIKDASQRVAVMIVSMYPEDQYAVRMLKTGAAGYLTKESAPDLLVFAVRRIARGGKYISPSLAEILAENVTGNGGRASHELLSNREYQIFCMIASGQIVSEIGVELSLSVKTISTYRSRILVKLGMTKNAEITYYAVKNNLVE